jgi:ATP-dependent DNA ligase
VGLAATFLTPLQSDDLTSTLYLLADNTANGTGPKTLMAAISELGDMSQFGKILRSTGDVGDAVSASIEFEFIQASITREPLYVGEVSEILRVSSKGSSRTGKKELLKKLISRCSPLESKYLARIIVRDLRVGFSRGLLLNGLSIALDSDEDTVRRMAAFSPIHEIPEQIGRAGLDVPRLFSPFRPMLAQPASSADEIIKRHGETSLERKIDGFRAMIHKSGSIIEIYSRSPQDVTEKLPDVVRIAKNFDGDFIIDCEIAGFKNGRIMPFQRIMRRFRKYGIEAMTRKISLRPFIFDVLYQNGRSLIDRPYNERRKTLEEKFTYLTVERKKK